MDGFPDVLKQAADIKSAQLKERPGRQDWERAPDWFKYTAYPDKEVSAARSGPLDQRLELCRAIKEAGNTQYEAEEAEAALQLYTRALSLFVWFDRGKDRASEDIPYVNSVTHMEDGPDRAQVTGLMAVLFNNAASCLIKLGKHDGAVYAATKALDHDPYNVKSLYRRASARRSLGLTAAMEEAVRDLQQAQGLEPDNAQVRSALALYQKELLEQNRKDAAIYGNMFSRGQLYEDQKGQQDAGDDVQVEPIGRDKSQDPDPHVVTRALRGMQHGMQRAHARGPVQSQWHGMLQPLRYLPWWAYTLIVLHLLYRIAKLWKLPMPSINGGSSTSGEHGSDVQEEL